MCIPRKQKARDTRAHTRATFLYNFYILRARLVPTAQTTDINRGGDFAPRLADCKSWQD